MENFENAVDISKEVVTIVKNVVDNNLHETGKETENKLEESLNAKYILNLLKEINVKMEDPQY